MIRTLLVLIATIFICLVVVNIGNECLMVLFRMGIRRAACDVLLNVINKQISFDPLVFFLRKNYMMYGRQ